ncbi:Vitamin D3 hydroxylase-associated protein [Orchesella cincta]|uniref:Vitamin D3 hydroxylase-associated protein n=1 Tax=Orchesella cincta TaxID=48709 RepID=A0A1D2MB61_ORCCI|nr:Vitamin D3 hydroxylase-associated protein [Orchesella cincta]
MSVNPEFLVKIQRRQEERKASFTKLASANVLDDAARQIVELDTVELIQQLQSRKLTATQVLKAYIAKALELTGRVNCVTEFIPQAFEWASKLDGLDTVAGPLHGLPIAVKEDHDVEDWIQPWALQNYSTNPQKRMRLCENPIYGQTLNSINEKMAPGGSSSGSASIVAGNGAPIAIGSDVGGSVRIPAFFHGLCSLRPTIRRLTEEGVLQCLPEVDAQRGVPGFIAKNAEALSLVWKAILGNKIQNDFDALTVPIPWNETLFSSTRKLTIGYFTSLAYFPAFPDVKKLF